MAWAVGYSRNLALGMSGDLGEAMRLAMMVFYIFDPSLALRASACTSVW